MMAQSLLLLCVALSGAVVHAFQPQGGVQTSLDTGSWRSSGGSSGIGSTMSNHQTTSTKTGTMSETDRLQALTEEWDSLQQQLEEFTATTAPPAQIPHPPGPFTAQQQPQSQTTTTLDDLTTTTTTTQQQHQEETTIHPQIPTPQPRAQIETQHALDTSLQTRTAPLPADSPDHWMQPHRILPHPTLNQTADSETYLQHLVHERDDHQRKTYFHRTPHNRAIPEYWQQLKAERDEAIRRQHEEQLLRELQHQENIVAEEAGRLLRELRHKEHALKATLAEFQDLQEQQQRKLEQLRHVKEQRRMIRTERQRRTATTDVMNAGGWVVY